MAKAEVQGFVHDKFEGVRDQFQTHLDTGADIGASFCVTKDGETVVDLWGGHADVEKTRAWEKDTIVNVYSTTKTMTALTALLLADGGELDFDAPVAKYWPEFAANGKADIKVSHLMSHSAGLSGWREPITNEDLYDWEKATSLLAAQAPLWEPGSAPGYHAITQGYLVGEVIRRVAGKTVGTVFREEIAGPLGADFHIGLPASEDARVADLKPPADASISADPTLTDLKRVTLTNPGGGGHGQCALGGDDPHDSRQWRYGERQALHERGGLPQGAGRTDPGHGPDPRNPGPLWPRLWLVRADVPCPQRAFHVLGRLWRLHRTDRHGIAHDHVLRDEPDAGHDDRRHAGDHAGHAGMARTERQLILWRDC